MTTEIYYSIQITAIFSIAKHTIKSFEFLIITIKWLKKLELKRMKQKKFILKKLKKKHTKSFIQIWIQLNKNIQNWPVLVDWFFISPHILFKD